MLLFFLFSLEFFQEEYTSSKWFVETLRIQSNKDSLRLILVGVVSFSRWLSLCQNMGRCPGSAQPAHSCWSHIAITPASAGAAALSLLIQKCLSDACREAVYMHLSGNKSVETGAVQRMGLYRDCWVLLLLLLFSSDNPLLSCSLAGHVIFFLCFLTIARDRKTILNSNPKI